MEFSRCTWAGPTQHEKTALAERSLKTQQRGNVEVDIVLGELRHRTAAETAINGRNAYRSKSSGIP
jgi:hypothetical protein